MRRLRRKLGLKEKKLDGSFFYIFSINVSPRQRIMQTHSRLIVKNEFVAVYVFSEFTVRTRQVAQQSSNFSSLKIFEVVSSVGDLLIGILRGIPLDPQVNNIIGLVL